MVAVLCGLVMGAGAANGVVAERERVAKTMPQCPPGPAIVIDPGHGGIDGGTNIPGLPEKDVVLDVALRMKQYLERNHVPVVLTREADVDLGGPNDPGRLRRDLIYRIRVANHCQAMLMLSLHVNHANRANEQGMMIFYQQTRPSRDAAWFFDTLLRRQTLNARPEAPIPRTDLAVLKTRAPSLLLELGFLSNPVDRALLADPAHREKIAQILASGSGAIYHQWLK